MLLWVLPHYAEQRAVCICALAPAIQRVHDVYVCEVLPRYAHEAVVPRDFGLCDLADVLVLRLARVSNKLHDQVQERLPEPIHLLKRLFADLLARLDPDIDDRELRAHHLLVQFG